MKIIHISDIHIEDQGKAIWDTDTKRHFNNVIEKLRTLGDIDAVIVTGDLSNDGSEWSYKYIDESFAALEIPTFCCPGNHDNLDVFYHGYKPSFYNTCEKFEIGEWTFIMLNSAVTGMSRGFFNPEALSKLIQLSSGPIVVVLHHPPIEQKGWLNRKLLENRDEFNDIIHQNKNVKLVLYGHTHYHTDNIINGVIYSSASSIGFAFHPSLPKFEIAHGKEGFSIIEFQNNITTVSDVNL